MSVMGCNMMSNRNRKQELELELTTGILRVVLVIPQVQGMELCSGNLRSQCEAMIVVLQGLMSSEVELVQGV